MAVPCQQTAGVPSSDKVSHSDISEFCVWSDSAPLRSLQACVGQLLATRKPPPIAFRRGLCIHAAPTLGFKEGTPHDRSTRTTRDPQRDSADTRRNSRRGSRHPPPLEPRIARAAAVRRGSARASAPACRRPLGGIIAAGAITLVHFAAPMQPTPRWPRGAFANDRPPVAVGSTG
jgi:hypothetical protein